MSDRATNLIWVDVETTGLDPRHDKLLEVGCVVTDADLREVAAASWCLHWKANDLLQMSTEVSGWHEKSGLLREVADSTTTLTTLTEGVLSFLREHSQEGASPLCGSTVGFDKAWLSVWLPAVVAWCHYRSIDVSTVKELAQRWRLPTLPKVEDKPHRALPDVRASIAELRFYRERYFADESKLQRGLKRIARTVLDTGDPDPSPGYRGGRNYPERDSDEIRSFARHLIAGGDPDIEYLP